MKFLRVTVSVGLASLIAACGARNVESESEDQAAQKAAQSGLAACMSQDADSDLISEVAANAEAKSGLFNIYSTLSNAQRKSELAKTLGDASDAAEFEKASSLEKQQTLCLTTLFLLGETDEELEILEPTTLGLVNPNDVNTVIKYGPKIIDAGAAMAGRQLGKVNAKVMPKLKKAYDKARSVAKTLKGKSGKAAQTATASKGAFKGKYEYPRTALLSEYRKQHYGVRNGPNSNNKIMTHYFTPSEQAASEVLLVNGKFVHAATGKPVNTTYKYANGKIYDLSGNALEFKEVIKYGSLYDSEGKRILGEGALKTAKEGVLRQNTAFTVEHPKPGQTPKMYIVPWYDGFKHNHASPIHGRDIIAALHAGFENGTWTRAIFGSSREYGTAHSSVKEFLNVLAKEGHDSGAALNSLSKAHSTPAKNNI